MTVKKTRKLATTAVPAQLRESAQQFLNVGLGAINKAHQEGNRVFEALVREGGSISSLHKKTRRAAESGVSEMAARATDTWDKLESVFESRVARALSSLGVPTRKEINDLSARVDALSKAIEKMLKGAAPAKSATKSVAKPVAKAATRSAAKPAAKSSTRTPRVTK